MTCTIENNTLKIEVNTAGAELKSFYHKPDAREVLWQGGKDWWPRKAPVLFPIVGKLNNNQFHLDDKVYAMPQHGFARDQEFELKSQTDDSLSFVLRPTGELCAIYPFVFELTIRYVLGKGCLETFYEVKNMDRRDMFFSIGAHPGFALHENAKLADYYIEFEKPETLDRHLLENGLFNGKTERVVTNSKTLDLNDELMKKDAIVFKDMISTSVKLKSRVSAETLKLDLPDFPYFGIWSKPGAAFICLEPWCGLADHQSFEGSLPDKEGIQHLEIGKIFERSFSIELVAAPETKS